MNYIRTISLFVLMMVGSVLPAQERTKPLNPSIDSIFPDHPTDYLTDLANVVKNPDYLNIRLGIIRDSLKLSLVAVTMPTIGRYQPDQVALEIGRKWMVATANDTIGAALRNTGGVILLVMDTHQCRIEVATGSEGYLTDAVAGELCRSARPEFRSGNFGAGILKIANGFADRHVAFLNNGNVRMTVSQTSTSSSNVGFYIVIFFVCVMLVIGFIILIVRAKEKKRERFYQIEQERQRAEANIRIAAREKLENERRKREEEAERLRWNSLTPQQQNAELAEKERKRQELIRLENERRERERLAREQAAIAWEADRPRREAEERRRYESDRRRRNEESNRRSSDDSNSSSWSSGGSDSFSGGGGGDTW